MESERSGMYYCCGRARSIALGINSGLLSIPRVCGKIRGGDFREMLEKRTVACWK